MPELPEVQTIVNELSKEIKGKKIVRLEVLEPKMVKGDVKRLEGLVVEEVRRRAKLIIVDLSDDYHLLFHLKLTGQLLYYREKKKQDDAEPARVVIHFADKSFLRFNDRRKFGYIKILTKKELEEVLKKEDYGPEPLEDEFTYKRFLQILSQRPNAQIKPLLMEQSFIAGIGNLYSDEILFTAKIHPKKKVSQLCDADKKSLYGAIKKILKEALQHKGSSLDTYRRTTGEKGDYEKHRRVYRRLGEPCFSCGSPIQSLKFGSRTSYFCPTCQKI